MNILQEARQKTHDLVSQINTVDRLMRDRLDPYVIIDELPLPIQIGEKIIYIGNLNLDNESYFFKHYAKILGNLGLQNMFIDLMKDGLELMKYLKVHDKLQNELLNLIGKVILKQQKWYYPKNDKTYKLNKCSMSYFRHNISKEKLVQILFLIYIYNYDSLGKSLALIINKMGAKGTTLTYMYSWLENLAGVSGNFLLSQLPNLDWHNKEQQDSDKGSNNG